MSNVPRDPDDYDPYKEDRERQIEGALRALIHQIELGDFTDAHGHKLTDNVDFIEAKEAVGK